MTADERLTVVLEEFLANAVEHGGEGPISVYDKADSRVVGISVVNGGEAVGDHQRPLLEAIGLAAHTLWGVTLGGSYVLPGRPKRLERLVDQF